MSDTPRRSSSSRSTVWVWKACSRRSATPGRLLGILNGVDYCVWDPSVDALIPARYSPADIGGKQVARASCSSAPGLPSATDAPVIGMVSRLADQKGFDLLNEAGRRHPRDSARVLVVLGTGQQEYHEFLDRPRREAPGAASPRT